MKDVKLANNTVDDCKDTSDECLTFLAGKNDRDSLLILTVVDASHADSDEYVNEWDEVAPFRSQGARLHVLADQVL